MWLWSHSIPCGILPLAGRGLASVAVNKQIKAPTAPARAAIKKPGLEFLWSCGKQLCLPCALGAAFAFTFPLLFLEEVTDRDRHDFLGTAHSDFYYDITRTYVCAKKIYVDISLCLASA